MIIYKGAEDEASQRIWYLLAYVGIFEWTFALSIARQIDSKGGEPLYAQCFSYCRRVESIFMAGKSVTENDCILHNTFL